MNGPAAFLIWGACCAAGYLGGWFWGVIKGSRYIQDQPRHFFPLSLDDADQPERSSRFQKKDP